MNQATKSTRSPLLILMSLILMVSPAMAGRPQHRTSNPRPRRSAHINRVYNRNTHRGYGRNIHRRYNRNTHGGYNHDLYGGYNYGLYGGGYYSPNRPYIGNTSSQTNRVVVVIQVAPKQTPKRHIGPKLKIISNPFSTKVKKNKTRPISVRAKIIAESKAKARSYVYNKDERKK